METETYVMDARSQQALDAHTAQHPDVAKHRVSASCPMCIRIIYFGTIVMSHGSVRAHRVSEDREYRAEYQAQRWGPE